MKRIAAVLVLTLIAIGTANSHSSASSMTAICNSFSPRIMRAYAFHEPVRITSNEDFVTQGWPGNGTANTPFLIDGLQISSNDECISISNTNSHFVIRNCILTPIPDELYRGDGVHLRNVTHGSVESCTASALGVGIYDWDGVENRIINNTVDQSWDGIALASCVHDIIANNTITGKPDESGIRAFGSQDCWIVGNTIGDISVMLSSNCTVIGNEIWGTGIQFISENLTQWQHQLQDNYVRGVPVGYFRDAWQLDINGSLFAQLFLVNCSDSRVQSGTFQHLPEGPQIVYSTSCTVSNILSSENQGTGFRIENSSDCTLTDSVITENMVRGIEIRSSKNITLHSNRIANSSAFGVYLLSSSDCQIADCNISANGRGVIFGSSLNCTLRESDILENDVGISLWASNNCLIVANRVHRNEYGIQISSSSSNNSIYWNSFAENSAGNANDDGLHNSWDDGVAAGNAWSDYSGFGVYHIPGLAQSVDRFPRVVTTPIDIRSLLLVLLVAGVLAMIFYSRKKFPYVKRVVKSPESPATHNIDNRIRGVLTWCLIVLV
jgi:parallel beta-helix repeat protein